MNLTVCGLYTGKKIWGITKTYFNGREKYILTHKRICPSLARQKGGEIDENIRDGIDGGKEIFVKRMSKPVWEG